MTIRVLVADEHPMARNGLRAILATQPDLEVVGETADGAGVVELARRARPDVVLLSAAMPDLDGVAVARRLTGGDDAAKPAVIMLSGSSSARHVVDAMRAGARGYLGQDLTADQLVLAVRAAAAGHAVLAPTVPTQLIEVVAVPGAADPPVEALALLSNRELTVLGLLAEGMTNAQIAGALAVGEATVKTHVSHLLGKLDLRTRQQATAFAHRHGLPGRPAARPGPRPS